MKEKTRNAPIKSESVQALTKKLKINSQALNTETPVP